MLSRLAAVAELLLLAASWTVIGWRLLPPRVRQHPDRLLGATSAFALGAGLTALLLTLLAPLHLLRPLDVRVLSGAGVLVAALIAVRRRQALLAGIPRWSGWTVAERVWAIVLVLVLALTLLATLAPPSAMDATVYHLRVPSEFLRTGTWTRLEEPQSFQPLNVEMLFAQGLALNGGVLAALVHWALGVAAIAVASCWARRLSGRAIWGAAVFGLTALFVWESSSAFIDLGLALFSSLAFFWVTDPDADTRTTCLAAVYAGLAGGSKFTGLLVVALVGAAGFARCWPDRGRAARRLVLIGALGAVVAAPWYVRNALLTGNPIYPLANRLFGLPPESLSVFKYGLGTGLGHLLTSPADLLARGDVFDQGWAVGPAFLAFVPLGLWLRRRSPDVRVIAGVLVAWWLIWFFSSPQTRLLLPIMPMAAGLAAVGVTACYASPSRMLRAAATLVLMLAAAGAAGTAALNATLNLPVVLGRESTDAFLERNSWSYTAYERANALLPPDAVVASTGVGVNLFYLDRRASSLGKQQLRSSDELRARGFSHELLIWSCPLPPLDDPTRKVWAEGTFPLRASRLNGGVHMQVCYRLSDVNGSR